MQYNSIKQVSVFVCSTSRMVKFMYKHSWRAHLSLIDKGEGLGERNIGCWSNWPWYDKAGSCLYWDTNFAKLVIEAGIIWLSGPNCSRTSIKEGYLFCFENWFWAIRTVSTCTCRHRKKELCKTDLCHQQAQTPLASHWRCAPLPPPPAGACPLLSPGGGQCCEYFLVRNLMWLLLCWSL